jgi:hypothetical protein
MLEIHHGLMFEARNFLIMNSTVDMIRYTHNQQPELPPAAGPVLFDDTASPYLPDIALPPNPYAFPN